MNLKEARRLIREEHVKRAAKLVRDHGLAWLYDRTGREEPKFRYIVIDGTRFPAKAFGFLVAQLAAETSNKNNDMTVNEAVAPLRKLGYVEVRGLEPARTEAEEQAREISYHQALSRPAQAKFRQSLLDACGSRCSISGITIASALEAAHVLPFRENGLDDASNGVLLRADLHKLFDAGHLAIEPSAMVARFSSAALVGYRELDGKSVLIPRGGPESAAFADRWKEFEKAHQPKAR